MKESSLQIHDEKGIKHKSPFCACSYLLSSQEFMMWCEFRMFTCVLTDCCSLDVTLICQLIYKVGAMAICFNH